MNNVKKYSLDESTGKMIENPCGGWFTAEDYYSLQDKLVANNVLMSQIEKYKRALENIFAACNHEWILDKDQKLESYTHLCIMRNACINDSRRIARKALFGSKKNRK